MKKVLFVLAVLFAFATTATAATATVDNKPPKGYNYQKARKQAARHNFYYRPHQKNGGCGWHKATR
jgi:hypothetical protein